MILTCLHRFPGQSATTNLVLFNEYFQEALNRSSLIDAIYIVFSKAFDHVAHGNILLGKLTHHVVFGPLFDWFISYLTSRIFTGRLESELSAEFVSTSGVPQGSHLMPYLFNIFISDIVDCTRTGVLMLANNTKLVHEVSQEQVCSLLQDNFLNLETWCLQHDHQH